MHLCMTPHGPDTATYESAIAAGAEQPAHLGRTTLAFMFETSLTPRVTPAALGSPCIDRDYYKCWLGLKSHFDREWQSTQQLAGGVNGQGAKGGGLALHVSEGNNNDGSNSSSKAPLATEAAAADLAGAAGVKAC